MYCLMCLAAFVLQRTVTRSEWDHIGVVVRDPKYRSMKLLEVNGDGVDLYGLEERIRCYGNDFTKDMCYRRLVLKCVCGVGSGSGGSSSIASSTGGGHAATVSSSHGAGSGSSGSATPVLALPGARIDDGDNVGVGAGVGVYEGGGSSHAGVGDPAVGSVDGTSTEAPVRSKHARMASVMTFGTASVCSSDGEGEGEGGSSVYDSDSVVDGAISRVNSTAAVDGDAAGPVADAGAAASSPSLVLPQPGKQCTCAAQLTDRERDARLSGFVTSVRLPALVHECRCTRSPPIDLPAVFAWWRYVARDHGWVVDCRASRSQVLGKSYKLSVMRILQSKRTKAASEGVEGAGTAASVASPTNSEGFFCSELVCLVCVCAAACVPICMCCWGVLCVACLCVSW